MPIHAGKKAEYDAHQKEVDRYRATKDVGPWVDSCRKAAATFAGSRDPEELDLRHRALSDAGSVLRSAGMLPEAEQQYEALSTAARAELGPDATAYLLARYFLGLTRQDRDDEAGAVAPLEEAVLGFEKRPNADQEVGLMGTALGLSLMRLHRFPEAVKYLDRARQRLAKLPAQANSLAAALHNLAMSQVRGGDAKAGLETAKQAVALREKINGASHPLTVETQFVEALARIDTGDSAGASALIRKGALMVLSGPGEAHPFFADALLLEARRTARAGDGTAAEALARRALFIIEKSGITPAAAEQRKLDAREIGALWRTGKAAKGPDDVALWKVSIQHTLRRYQFETLDFAGSGDRPKVWFFFVPASWPLTSVTYATQLVFGGCNAFLNSREPADASFLDATSAQATVPTERELLDTKLDDMFRSRVWEPSIGYSLVGGASSTPLSPADFALALAAFLLARKAKGNLEAWLAPLGADLSPARADPKATLQRLFF